MRLGAVCAHRTLAIVALSILIAIVVSLVALWLAFRFRAETRDRRAAQDRRAPCVMGLAVAAMHYTGMAAATFMPGRWRRGRRRTPSASPSLGIVGITLVTFVVLVPRSLMSIVDRRFSAQSLRAAKPARRATDRSSIAASPASIRARPTGACSIATTRSRACLATRPAKCASREAVMTDALQQTRASAKRSSRSSRRATDADRLRRAGQPARRRDDLGARSTRRCSTSRRDDAAVIEGTHHRHHRAQAGRAGARQRARGGRSGQPRQERVPGQHEPRDPDADERRHRHDRARARHGPDARAARVPRDGARSSADSLLGAASTTSWTSRRSKRAS